MDNKKKDYSIFNTYYDEINIDFWNDHIKKCLKILSNTKLINGFAYDFGCGTGSGLELIKALGYKNIKGIDLSNDMIKLAKSKYDNIDFVVGNMLVDPKWDPGSLAICNFDAINYLIGEDEWPIFFSTVSNSLKKNGIFLFDVLTVNDHKNNWPNYTRVIENENYVLINHGDYKDNIAYMYYTWFIKNINNLYDKYIEIHRQRTYPIDKINEWLNYNDFKVIDIIDADTGLEVKGKTNRLIYKCIKK